MADLKEASQFESIQQQRSHWYYQHKIACIRNLLERHSGDLSAALTRGQSLRAMDIGAGNGIISRSIGTRFAGLAVRWDLVDSAYTSDVADHQYSVYRAVPGDAAYDLIIAIDVVEHIQDDRRFVEFLASRLRPNGLLLICVPAFQFLWSNHDVFLEHYRRYRLAPLERLVGVSRLQIIDSGYTYILLFPLILVVRLAKRLLADAAQSEATGSDLRVYPGRVNSILASVMGFERFLVRILPRLTKGFGLSCVVLAKNKESLKWL